MPHQPQEGNLLGAKIQRMSKGATLAVPWTPTNSNHAPEICSHVEHVLDPPKIQA